MIVELRGPAASAATPAAAVLPVAPAEPRCRGRSRLDVVGDAAVRALAYGDVFDWPLTVEEIHRWLPVAATIDEVRAAVGRLLDEPAAIEPAGPYLALPGRGHLVASRRRREETSAGLWPRAVRLASAVAALPFVRLVAVTGSLAVNAATDAADVDLLIVTRDGRLWFSRAMAMGIVRAAALLGIDLCPNYLVAESNLPMDEAEQSLFTAHELVQAVPVGPSALHEELLGRNAWYRDFLPNARPTPARRAGPATPERLRRLAEAALPTAVVDRFERWEMERKVARLTAASASIETRYDAACCKGHADEHGRRVMAAYEARLVRLEGGS